MKTTATELRSHLYTWLDKVAGTGEVLEVKRKGVVIRISREPVPSRLARLPKRSTMTATPQEIAEQGWADSWKGDS